MNPLVRNIAIGVGIAFAAFLIIGRNAKQKQEDAALGFTEDTGVVGVLGATANRASGGLLARFGSFIGAALDPINRKSLDELTELPVSKVGVKGTKSGNVKLEVVGGDG